jgi:hypothetical protein|tara:strand:- start:115 stop:351 length:237 start_codon:yes stop_codon:yes gene_type:complete
MSDGDKPAKKQRRKKTKQDASVTVSGVSADGESNERGGEVETRDNPGAEAPENKALKAARKLLQAVVRKVRKLLRIDA